MIIYYFLLAIALSLIISLVTSYFTKKLFVARGWVEDPHLKQQKTHNATALYPVPRGGGIPVFLGILITSLFFLPLDKHLIGILLAAFFTLVIGVWDDLKDISPKLRLITNTLAALIVVASGIGIAYISNPLGGIIDLSLVRIPLFLFNGWHYIWLFADILAVLWIVWCINIVGWSAGVEGQLPGFTAISAIFVGLLGLRFSTDTTQWPVIILAGAVAGSYLGFLPLNFYPQKMMPGYSGKSLAGFFLAVLAVLSGAKLATVILLLGVPMLDAAYVMAKRLISRKPIYVSDGNHLHHQLLKNNWSRPQIALFYWLVTLILGCISLFLNSSQKLYAFLGLAVLFLGFTLQFSRRNEH